MALTVKEESTTAWSAPVASDGDLKLAFRYERMAKQDSLLDYEELNHVFDLSDRIESSKLAGASVVTFDPYEKWQEGNSRCAALDSIYASVLAGEYLGRQLEAKKYGNTDQVARSEPSVHEEVIGYSGVNRSGLQLVGGDILYLQTEVLREHILMSEHRKEVQPVIVEGSENVVVQAFSRESEAVVDEAAFTVNQLDSAITATLSEQFIGVQTITTSEGQQQLILSENANRNLVGMEGTPVEQSAAAPDTDPLFHEGSKGGAPGQCVASLEDIQTELQQGCKELSEENGSSEADAIPENVHAPEQSAESKYENDGRSHTLAPVHVHETSSSDVSLVFSRGDSSEYWEKPAASVREPEQDTEEQKNGAVDMNTDCLNENLSGDMTVASAQSLEPGAVLNLDASEMPLAPVCW
ncbi:hypothetical protein HPB50_012047 [Hyalomma asiaticum]|uniref:Uncharacterized protein n=1 Tax=Hyalomma asiaticum TaxID=266040 RepID=A0ACB7TGM7_HYAAI|nr:hypothetical protein HPB50_012047 [Hyalomma asiaticum]